jgi:hypothetical protein
MDRALEEVRAAAAEEAARMGVDDCVPRARMLDGGAIQKKLRLNRSSAN